MSECSTLTNLSLLLVKFSLSEGSMLLWFYSVHAGPSELLTFMKRGW